MKHTVSHSLGRDMARKVARSACESYAKRFSDYSPTTKWKNDDTADIGFSAKGISLTGQLAVTDSSIDLELDVPFLLKPFKSKAVGVIDKEIREWIGKAEKGEIA